MAIDLMSEHMPSTCGGPISTLVIWSARLSSLLETSGLSPWSGV